MKKENIMIPFESEQLAALDFSLKKKKHKCAGADGKNTAGTL